MRLLGYLIMQVFVSVSMIQAQATLPNVFSDSLFDKLGADLRQQAKTASWALTQHNETKFSAEYKNQLKSNIIKHAVSKVDHSLDLKFQVKGSVDMEKFIIENISYQSQEGIYVTANLYRPKAEGVYPAVITTHGHWANGRRTEIVQTTGQLLALNGFVCLAVDAWGVGERASNPLEHEYHGSNLGASLMNVGNTLLGLQLIDNQRGVDLLCSLPYVDSQNIGATGASGGGNQAMWLAAMDERVKAVVPVVSVGTFESYVMNSNCVCELLPQGLIFTEEDAVIGLIAPRAINIFTAMNDANPSFVYSQMKRTYKNALRFYEKEDRKENIAYSLFNRGHGYWEEMQMEMLSYFTKHLKGDMESAFVDVSEVKLQDIRLLATYPNGKIDKEVQNTEVYCKQKGTNLKNSLLSSEAINVEEKKSELREILSIRNTNRAKNIKFYSEADGWGRVIIETEKGHLIPILYKLPQHGSSYTIVANSKGKNNIPPNQLAKLISQGSGVVLVDLWGVGESKSEDANRIDGALPAFHTLSRSSLWLGQSVIGRWVEELNNVIDIVEQRLQAEKISIWANREVAVATLFCKVLAKENIEIELDELPHSYLFDNREQIDYYNMSIHIPHMLEWGDISLALALSEQGVMISNFKTLSGNAMDAIKLQKLADEVKFLQKKMNIKKSKVETYNNILTLNKTL